MINWNATKKDRELINKITNRATKLFEVNDSNSKLNIMMDIAATHLNGCPLKLTELLKADDMNFYHDVYGIRRHLNRTTGELENCFLPRFARPYKH